MKRKKQCLLKRTRREWKEEAAKPIYCSTGRQETTISQRVFISIRIIPFPEMCLCQWNTTPRASTIPWAKSLEHEKGQVCSMPWWIGPRGHLEPRLFFRRGDIVYERKWAEAKKPIHRFLDRVPLQMSSRRRRNASFWRPEIVLVVSLRKRVNAGKFRTRSQTGHFARSRRFVSVWFLVDLWIVLLPLKSWYVDALRRLEETIRRKNIT